MSLHQNKNTPMPTPCYSCPYKFGSVVSSCTQVSVYPDCVWGKYLDLLTKSKERRALERSRQDPELAGLEARAEIARLKVEQRKKEVNHDS